MKTKSTFTPATLQLAAVDVLSGHCRRDETTGISNWVEHFSPAFTTETILKLEWREVDRATRDE